MRPAKRALSTLDPTKLRPSDWLDISGTQNPRLALPFVHQSLVRLRYGSHRGKRLNFPPHTRGFFHYYTPPKAPPLVGELRFRLAADPKSFQDGQDLLSFKSVPWTLTIPILATSRSYAALRDQLLYDHLISQTSIDKWIKVKKDSMDARIAVGRLDVVLYYLRQPFFLPFSCQDIEFYAVTNEEIGYCSVKNPLMDYRMVAPPYSGSGIAQLEPCPGGGSVSFRILKIIEPVQTMFRDYDGYIHPPAEGALVQRSFPWQTPVTLTRSLTTMSMMKATVLPVDFEDLP